MNEQRINEIAAKYAVSFQTSKNIDGTNQTGLHATCGCSYLGTVPNDSPEYDRDVIRMRERILRAVGEAMVKHGNSILEELRKANA